MKKQVSAGIIVYHRLHNEPEYLLLQYAAGHWDLAKGKLEAGETKIEAALRELMEETGISKIAINEGFEESLFYKFKDFDGSVIEKTVYFFVGEVTKADVIILSREHRGYAWLPYDKALKQLTYQNAKDILKNANSFIAQLT
jgi:bis(5'-nucleosidyl)-tetraphosphatase